MIMVIFTIVSDLFGLCFHSTIPRIEQAYNRNNRQASGLGRNKGHQTNKCSDLQPSPIVLIVVAGGRLTFSLIADSGKLITV